MGIFRPHQLAFDMAKRSSIVGLKTMDRYNKLKIRTLKVFAFAPGAWFKPGEVAERLVLEQLVTRSASLRE